MGKKSKGVKSKDFGKINKAWKADKVKAKRQAVKKVEIRRDSEFPSGNTIFGYYAKPSYSTWATGYARPFTAKRGAERHFRDFIAKGGRLEFIKNY